MIHFGSRFVVVHPINSVKMVFTKPRPMPLLGNTTFDIRLCNMSQKHVLYSLQAILTPARLCLIPRVVHNTTVCAHALLDPMM